MRDDRRRARPGPAAAAGWPAVAKWGVKSRLKTSDDGDRRRRPRRPASRPVERRRAGGAAACTRASRGDHAHDRLLGDLVAGQLPTTAPSRSTRTRSAPSTSSSRSEEMSTHAEALLGELVDEGLHLGLGADVDAAGRLVEQQHLRVQASQRASSTFCWLPPDSSRTFWCGAGRLDPQPLDEGVDDPVAGAVGDEPGAGEPGQRGERRCSRGPTASGMMPSALRSSGSRRDARPGSRRPGARRAVGSPPTVTVPASSGSAPKMAFAVSVRPEPSSPPRPTTSPGRARRRTRRAAGARRVRPVGRAAPARRRRPCGARR